MKNANCLDADPEIFFPKRGRPHQTLEAQKICARCTVRKDCDDYRERTNTTDGIYAAKIYRLGKTS